MRTATGSDTIDLTDGANERSEPDRDADRGRQADAPGDVPATGWKDVALRVKDQIREDQVPLLAAGVAFYLLLALFPALAALVSTYGLVADPADVARQVSNVTETLPDSARELVTEQLESIVSGSGGGLGLAVIAGVLTALWTASSGMKHLVGAVNAAYDESESRGFLALRGMALGLTFGAIVLGTVAIGVLTALPVALTSLPLGGVGQLLIRIASFALLAVAFAGGLAVLYRYGPDRDQPQWRWVTWGAGIATVLWVVGSIGFSVYVSNFGSYSETYGSIGAVIVLMLWLLLTAFAVVLGAEIDSELEAQTARDSTVGDPEPMGQRDAEKADHLGETAS